MIIDTSEIAELEAHLEHECECARLERTGKTPPNDNAQSPVFIANRPHLLMPLGFDEFQAVREDDFAERPVVHADVDWAYPVEVFFRRRESGAWTWFEGFTDYTYANDAPDKHGRTDFGVPHAHIVDSKRKWHPDDYICLDSYPGKLRKLADSPDPRYHQLIFPGLWTPQSQADQTTLLEAAIHDILGEIASEERELASVGWRQLEEIVAELLRARDMKVSLTPGSKDGGRDIIARGELIPGEPTVLAVEVKKKPVVGLHDVQRALRANEDFPALLVATSGRFSAGVLKERQRSRNQLRLYLKDGVALGQWVKGWDSKYRKP